MDRTKMIKNIIDDSIIFFPHIKSKFQSPTIGQNKLTPLQFMTMGILFIPYNRDGLTMNKIANFLQISKQQCTKLIDSLVEMNFLDRDLNPSNRREIIVKITPTGMKHFNDIKEKREDELAQKYSVLSDEELEELYNHLQAIKEILSKTQNKRDPK